MVDGLVNGLTNLDTYSDPEPLFCPTLGAQIGMFLKTHWWKILIAWFFFILSAEAYRRKLGCTTIVVSFAMGLTMFIVSFVL
jgi:hypothetical protein